MQDFSDNFFLYDGKKYFFSAVIYTYTEDTEELNFGLRNSNIVQFEYVNEFNKLFLEGSLTYQDNYGIIDKFLEKSIIYVGVVFARMEQEFDGEITIEKVSDVHKFTHTFIVNGIKIIKRENHIITYKLSLLSVNWIKCIKNISYSNYQYEPQPIFDIIKSMLSINELNVDKDTFESVSSPVKLHYITNGNDNTITTINYLLGKLYYYSLKDTCFKFIIYNDTSDKYQILTVTDENTYLGNSSIILSLFKTTIEQMTQEDPNDLNSVTKFPKEHTYENDFAKVFFDFNYNKNEFIDASIKSKSILQFQNNYIATDIYKDKFEFFDNDLAFRSRGCYWNNDFNIYTNSVKTMIEDSSIVVNTVGEILRKPGYFVQINVDRDSKYIEADDLDKAEDIKNKYKTFEGAWIVSKVRNIIFPSVLESKKKKYRQNLVLGRNYIKRNK